MVNAPPFLLKQKIYKMLISLWVVSKEKLKLVIGSRSNQSYYQNSKRNITTVPLRKNAKQQTIKKYIVMKKTHKIDLKMKVTKVLDS